MSGVDRLDELKACARPRPEGAPSPSVGAWAVAEIEQLRDRITRALQAIDEPASDLNAYGLARQLARAEAILRGER